MSDKTPDNLTPAAGDVPEAVRDLVDDYFADALDAGRLADLERLLAGDVAARRFFARYALLDRDLRLEARAGRQTDAVLARIGVASGPTGAAGAGTAAAANAGRGADPVAAVSSAELAFPGRRYALRPPRWAAAAAVVALAVSAGWWAAGQRQRTDKPDIAETTDPTRTPQGPTTDQGTKPVPPPTGAAAGQDVAWLVNAQNCQWAAGTAPGDMKPGTRLDVDRGLAEVKFRSGAVVLLDGPARLELLSDNSARLHRGRLTGKVAGPIKGFELFSPGGKVIDLGTEFGVSVADGGQTDVYVFAGKVQAVGLQPVGGVGSDAKVLDLTESQSARLEATGAAVRRDARSAETELFVRDIVPPPVIEPRTAGLNFGKAYNGTVADAQGYGTGLTHRLPGTGEALADNDPNLVVNADAGRLELTTTDSDINGQARLPTGEYLGVRLADLGFTGSEDFEVQVFLPNVPALQNVGQFGLYAGARSDKVIRGGLISRGNKSGAGAPPDAQGEGSYTVFMTNNDGGRDRDSHALGLFSMGDDIRVRLSRTGGKYALTVENATTGSATTLAVRHPAFLDAENDLYVGLFGANTQSEVRRTLFVKEFTATVWTTAGGRSMAGRTLPTAPLAKAPQGPAPGGTSGVGVPAAVHAVPAIRASAEW